MLFFLQQVLQIFILDTINNNIIKGGYYLLKTLLVGVNDMLLSKMFYVFMNGRRAQTQLIV